MGIKPMFGSGAVAAKVMAFQQNLERATEFLLKYLGEELAKYAKDNHNYTDQTGNLTNSIGYAVVRNKEIVYSGGENQPGEGFQEALKVAMKMAAKADETFSLIIVAGMNYAAYVEARGYNVILPAELKAKKDFPEAMNKLMEKAKGKANELSGTSL
jgi:hypothetical protein